MIKIYRNNLNLITELLDEIHDRYFHFKDIVFDKDSGELKIPLGERRRWFFGNVIVTKVLKVTKVVDFHFEDTAQISQNSINEVHIDLNKGLINIECNAPGEISFTIKSDFEISLEKFESK